MKKASGDGDNVDDDFNSVWEDCRKISDMSGLEYYLT